MIIIRHMSSRRIWHISFYRSKKSKPNHIIVTRSGNQTQVLPRDHAQRRMQHHPSPTLERQTNQPVQPSYLLEPTRRITQHDHTKYFHHSPQIYTTTRKSTTDRRTRAGHRLTRPNQTLGRTRTGKAYLIKHYDEHKQGKHTRGVERGIGNSQYLERIGRIRFASMNFSDDGIGDWDLDGRGREGMKPIYTRGRREKESREATAPSGVGPSGERPLRRGLVESVPTAQFRGKSQRPPRRYRGGGRRLLTAVGGR